MPIQDQIPTMTDEALATLQGNARRLEQSGTAAQRKAAADLLPAIAEEVAQRAANRPAPVRKPRAKKSAAAA